MEQSQLSFDPAKESVHVVSHAQPYGDPFKLLGICFDCKLRMDLAVRDVVSQASWELTTILTTRRFHGVSQLVQVYKSKVLSFVEYRTPAVHHAAKTTLAGIDAGEHVFALSAVGFPETRRTTFITQEASSFANVVTLCIGTR